MIRGALYLLSSAAFAYFLVPTWSDLEPSRSIYMVGWTLLVTIVTMIAEPIAHQLSGSRQRALVVPSALLFLFVAGAVVLLLADSLRFSQMAISFAGAVTGLLMVIALQEGGPSVAPTLFPISVALCGLMLIGQVNSFSPVPWCSYILVAIAPLGLWSGQAPIFGRWKEIWRLGTSIAVPCSAAAIAVIMAALAALASP